MISIIVPVYNSASYIAQTISSVIDQTFTDWELILVDDCSSDGSADVIRNAITRFDKKKEDDGNEVSSVIRLIQRKQNGGAAQTRNTGIDAANGRYIAFLDADDIWDSMKLEKEFKFMQKYDAPFVFTAYRFGDENAVPTGKAVRVPKHLDYRKALSRTIIFTSTVLIDTEKVDRKLIHMPDIASEDTATWWQILRAGIKAYGLDQPLVIYRRPAGSLSSNKGKAGKKIWNLYRNEEHLGIPASCFYFAMWAIRAVTRRTIDDSLRGHFESLKRFITLQLSIVGCLITTAVFAWAWFRWYYPVISSIRISREGYALGNGLKLYVRGHILVLVFYFLILIFMSIQTGAMKIGNKKPDELFLSSAISVGVTNIVFYFQMSLMRNWLVPVQPLLIMYIAQILILYWGIKLSDVIYNHVFPPREMLVIRGSKELHDGALSSAIDEFEKREERFRIMKSVSISEGIDKVEEECLLWYGCVFIGNVSSLERKKLLEFCYGHYIRVYELTEVKDLLIRGADVIDQFHMPILEYKEYSIRWEERCIKRLSDIILSLLCIIVSSPVMLYKVLCALGHGDKVITKTICVSKNGAEFTRHTFTVAGFGHFLPMLFDVLKGSLSLIGPEPLRADLYEKLIEENPQFAYRSRVKAGFTGKAQRNGMRFEKKDGTINIESHDSIMMIDIDYLQGYSLLEDFRLLLTINRC